MVVFEGFAPTDAPAVAVALDDDDEASKLSESKLEVLLFEPAAVFVVGSKIICWLDCDAAAAVK